MSAAPITSKTLDPTAIQIGVLIGLLNQTGEDTYVLNDAWFSDPWSYISKIPSNPQMFELITTLMGSASGSALGTPTQALNRTWYPVMNTSGDEPKPTGIYIVSGTPEGQTNPEMGIGSLYSWPFDNGSFTVLPYAYFPLFTLPDENGNGFGFVLGQSGHPVQVGVQVNGGTDYFSTGDGVNTLSFDGFTAGVDIFFSEGNYPLLNLVFQNLQLPGETQGSNRSIFDLIENTSVQEWITTALSVLGSQLAQQQAPLDTAGKMIHSLMEMLGLLGNVPSIDWNAVVEDPSVTGRVLTNWMRSIASEQTYLRNWLNAWYCLFTGKDSSVSTDNVTGSGTRIDPFAVEVLKLQITSTIVLYFDIGFASVTDSDQTLHIFPEVIIRSKPILPLFGFNEFGVDITGQIELLEFTVPSPSASDSTPVFTLFPGLSIMAVAANTVANKPLIYVTGGTGVTEGDENSIFSIDSMQVGFTYDRSPEAVTDVPAPNFRLVNVQTAIGSWPVIDLSTFNAEAILDLIGPIVTEAIESFFGENDTYAKAFEAVLGITAPSGYTGTWPLQDQLLLSPSELTLLIQNPFNALGAYYTRCLQTNDGSGISLFSYLIPNIATLLGGTNTAVAGTGTSTDPWRITVMTLGSADMQLMISYDPSESSVLHLLLGFEVPLVFSGVSAGSTTAAELLRLTLPQSNGEGSWGGDWMQRAYTSILLTNEGGGQLETPALAGVSLSAANVYGETGWSAGEGFYAEASINDVQLKSESTTIELGNLIFGTTNWSAAQLTQFAPAIVNGSGLLLLENAGRTGVTTTTLLGLLPDMPEILNGSAGNYDFPVPEIALPTDWPSLTITNFSNPWADVRTQLSNIYAGGSDMVIPALRLIGWTFTGTLPAEPPAQAGTLNDPWKVALADSPVNLALLTFLSGSNQIGIGAEMPLLTNNVTGLTITTAARLDMPGFVITPSSGTAPSDPEDVVYPRLLISCALSNSDTTQPLVSDSQTGLQIGSVQLGFAATLQEDVIFYSPVFIFLNSRVQSSDPLSSFELVQSSSDDQWSSPQGLFNFNTLINAMMVQLSSIQQTTPLTQLQGLFDVLTGLQLVRPVSADGKTDYGFNSSSWNAFLANPTPYLEKFAAGILSNPALAQPFLDAAAAVTGIHLTLPDGLPQLLYSLGIFKEYNSLYVPDFAGCLEFAKAPADYLKAHVALLIDDSDLLTSLISAIQPYASTGNNWFSIDSSGYIVNIGILPTSPYTIGNELQLSGMITIDFNAYTLSATAAVASSVLGSALQINFNPVFLENSFSGNPSLYLTSDTDGTLPAPFAPLQLWPIPQDLTPVIEQLSVQVPVTLLSAFATSYLNTYATPQNPAVLNLFNVLGLSFTDDTGTSRIRPLAGIFMHPAQWLLSPKVLGDSAGGIDLTRLGNLLYAIVDVAGISSGDVQLIAYSRDGKNDGVKLTGLPWGVTFVLYSNSEEGVNFSGTFTPEFSAPMPGINLSAGLSFGNGNGLNVSGLAELNYYLGTNSSNEEVRLGISTSYDRGNFALSATSITGTKTLVLPLLPFTGLNQFLEGAAEFLLQTIGDMLFAAYDVYVADNPGTSLVGFVENIEALTGITDGESMYNFFDAIYENPLGAFDPENINSTVSGMNTFLSNILMLSGFSVSSDGKYLQYLISFKSVPEAKILLQVGVQTINTGNESLQVFGIWVEPVAQFQWVTLGLSGTGIGVESPIDTSNPNLVYAANFVVTLNPAALGIEGMPTPALLFGINGTLNGVNGPFLQLFPVAQSTDAGTLRIDLLPNCKLVIVGNESATSTDWMLAFGTDFLVPFVANMALATDPVKSWLDDTTIGTVKGAPGIVLVNWGLLIKTSSGNYLLNNLKTAFNVNDPTSIVTTLIFSALDLLNGQCVVPINGKGIYVQSAVIDGRTRYGLRVEIPDIVVIGPSAAGSMQLTFQLGKYFGKQDKSNNWTGIDSEPGLVAYFIVKDSAGNLSFWPRFELLSIGFDFTGPNDQKPLVNLNGVTIQGVEPRVLVVLDFIDEEFSSQFGAATMIDSIGIPLGPGFSEGGGNTNPVAQNLLTSGGNPGKTDAINPAFSVSAAYVYEGSGFTLQLYSADGSTTNKVIIPIMRAFGPLQCRKIGIGWENAAQLLSFLFDGSVSLAGLTADVQDLEIGIPVTDPTNFDGYTLDLAGLDVTFKGGSVVISGGFLKDNSQGYIQYIGQAQIRAAQWGLGAFGAYALVDDNVSLFIFAYLNAPIGGVPEFFITGLSGGFGYNRAINLPRADQVYNFPLVAGISDSSKLGGVNGNPPTNTQALQALGTTIAPPQLGSYWLAAGIKFTTYEILKSQAMLVVQFGSDFMIGLLGVSGLQLPDEKNPYVGAQMAFTVTYRASTGLLALEAVLTPNSYVLSPDCRLTGGMAFYIWSKNLPDGASAGEFVLTLGGYNTRFKKPTYFPDEPRLGFSWNMGDVTIKGGAYFALTPSAIMAGGSLEAVYKTGNLKAWFNAWADFLIMWKPFHFYITAGVNVGASYTVTFIWKTTFKVELGAELELWGPSTAGSVTVKWWVISFTVKFGDQSVSKNGAKIIEWPQFTDYFLPKDQAPNPPPQQTPEGNAALARTYADQPVVQQVSHIKAVTGLLQELDDNGSTLWQVAATQFVFSVSTIVPLNYICYNSDSGNRLAQNDVAFGIRPLGSVVFSSADASKQSTLSVTISMNGVPYNSAQWNFISSVNGVAYSLWGTINDGKSAPDSKIIPGALVGLSAVQAVPAQLPAGPPMFPVSNFTLQPLPYRALTLWNDPWLHPAEPAQHSDEAVTIIEQTVMQPAVQATRLAILETVLATGINVVTDGRLDMMAAYASAVFQSSPMLGTLGSIGEAPAENSVQTARRFSFTRTTTKSQSLLADEPSVSYPLVRAYSLQYPSPVLRTSVFMAATAEDAKHMIPVKGAMYNSDVFSSAVDKAMLRGVTQNSSESDLTVTLVPGGAAIVDLDGVTPMTVQTAGVLPVYTVEFDEHNQFIGGTLIAPETSFNLDPLSTQTLFYGVDTTNVTLPYALGWHTTSQLIQINPNALSGIGAVVVPQSPTLIRSSRRWKSYGLIDGSLMQDQNIVEMPDGHSNGSVLTLFPTNVQTVAVLFVREDSAEEPSASFITVRVRSHEGETITYETITAASFVQGSYEYASIYALPAATADIYEIQATADSGWKITGVIALNETTQAVTDNWKEIVLKPAVADNVDAMSEQSTVLITPTSTLLTQ